MDVGNLSVNPSQTSTMKVLPADDPIEVSAAPAMGRAPQNSTGPVLESPDAKARAIAAVGEQELAASEEGRKKRATMMRRRSTASSLNEDYARKINSYVAQRKNAKALALRSVTIGGLSVAILGCAGFQLNLAVSGWWGWWSHIFHLLMQLGMAIASTSDLDVDGVMRGSRWLPHAIVLVLGGLFGGLALNNQGMNGPWSGATLLPLLLYALRRRSMLEHGLPFRFTEMLSLVFVASEGTRVIGALHHYIRFGWQNGLIMAPVCALNTVVLIWVASASVEDRGSTGRPRRGPWLPLLPALRFKNPTVRYWIAFATYSVGNSISTGLSYMLNGPALDAWWKNPDKSLGYVALGLVLFWGATIRFRDTVFGLFARRFENQMRLRDGAVIASLLDKRSVAVGDVHHVQDMAAHHELPSSKHFYAGQVVEVGESQFVVEIDEAELPAPKSVAKRTVVPLSHEHLSPEALLEMACESLFGVDFSHITQNMLGRAPPKAEWFTMSRRCRPGQIDWFVSHSWSDDPNLKFFALTSLAEVFRAERGRYPICWLDKCCIEQTSQAKVLDALKCLPLYLNACRTTVVLAAEIYFTRMWCIWELYVLFALADGEPSLKVLQLAGKSASERLRDFQLDHAHCFDPNQEAELRAAIDASPGGAFAFERTLQALAPRLESKGGEGKDYDVDDLRQCPPRQPSFAGQKIGSFRVLDLDEGDFVRRKEQGSLRKFQLHTHSLAEETEAEAEDV